MPGSAKLSRTKHGLVPAGAGWFVVNARKARWWRNERFGRVCVFEGKRRFPQVGINIHVLEPGQSNGLYHRESEQEDFLVLAGKCLVLIEGREVRLSAWDFVHCPPGTDHIFVGAGSGPCAILMVGGRRPKSRLTYPVSPLGRRHGASVLKPTHSPAVAYAGAPRWRPGRGKGVLPK